MKRLEKRLELKQAKEASESKNQEELDDIEGFLHIHTLPPEEKKADFRTSEKEERMNSATHMNYLALNQNILCKPLRFGMGPEDGIETEPHLTKAGFKVYLNGTHANPGHSQIENHLLIGRMKHPHAMDGMPGCSGELEYYLCLTETDYIAIVSPEIGRRN